MTIICSVITGHVEGINKIWFFGDEFVFNSFEKYYKQRLGDDDTTARGYVKNNFEILPFHNNRRDSINQNLVSRLLNLMPRSIREQKVFPKIIVVVPDDDIITYFGKFKNGASEAYGKLINHTMIKWDRLILTQKEYLPAKAKKPDWPKLVCIIPPLHDNFKNNNLRIKFAY